jgi:hypothetical protein
LLLLLSVPRLAYADFDANTGVVSLEDAAFGLTFDGPGSFPEGMTVVAYDQGFTPIPDLEPLFIQGELAGIEGEGSLELGGDRAYLAIDLRPIAAPLRGRRVEIKLWQRLSSTITSIEVSWYSGNVDAIFQGGQEGSYERIGSIPFQPTGRVTDDGWQEWTSGPFDFSLAGEVDLSLLTFLDEHVAYAYRQVSNFDPTVRAGIDALGVYDLGAAAVPAAACNLIVEAETCGASGACHLGKCADAAAVVGPKLENLELRDEYLFRRTFLLENLEGGRGPLARFGAFRTKIEALRTEPSNVRYWTSMHEAFDGLADGHASEPLPSYPAQLATGVCMYQGEADLMPGSPIAPLVFEVPSNPIGQLLRVGDMLVEIDGVPVDEWRSRATRLLRYGGDPAGRDYITTPQIMNAALMVGSTLTFERCASPDPVIGPCAPADVARIDVDMRALAAGLYTGDLPAWRFDFVTCDFRYLRPVDDARVREYSFAGFADSGDVRHVLINGVPGFYGPGGQEWFTEIELALDGTGPTTMVLDERQGGGGSIEAVDMMANRYLAPDDFYSMDLFPQLSQTLDVGLRDALRECSRSQSFFGYCGNAFEWILGEQTQLGGAGLASTSKLAVLTGLDVSGNDYLTKLLTYRSGETRIFGAVPTYGAYGVVWALPALAGELTGGSVQVHDTVFVQGPEDENLDFNTGTGVAPDEVVLQKQSDLILGTDTLLERARAWLAE